jgi:hypothetical protein
VVSGKKWFLSVFSLRLPLGTTRKRLALTVFLAASLVASLLGACGVVYAQEEEAPQLPILLLNGALYPQRGNAGSLPPAFKVDEYPRQTVALYLLHFEGPIRESWVEDVRRIGGDPRGYLPYNTLLVAMDRASYSRLGELGFVRWSGLYQPYYKVSPALQLRLAQGGKARILVELFSSRFLIETLDALGKLPVEVLGAEADSWCAVIAVRLPLDKLKDVAALPAVEWLELYGDGTLTGVPFEAAPAGGAGTVKTAGGGSEKVALGDTGVGTGGLQGIPEALAGKVSTLNSLRGDEGGDPNGHGTAMAGVVVGVAGQDESSAANCEILCYATGYGLQAAPRPLSLFSLLQGAQGSGARIFLSGSVPEGKESLGAYGIFASQRDAFAWGNPSMALVEAAGNEGTDADGDGVVDKGSLLGGAAAKNTLSLGGSESARKPQGTAALSYGELQEYFSGRFPSAPLRDDSSVGPASGMAAISSRGPTPAGRIKPDLVAPATAILSISSGAAVSFPGGTTAPDPGQVLCYGTGMAAAQAAAMLASMRQVLYQNLGREPSAALLKAFALNGAVDLSPGQYKGQAQEIPQAPNAVEGWGKMDLGAFNRQESWVKVMEDAEGLRLGESRTFKIEVPSGKQLRVTLAWTDYPSLPEARLHLVNDLDLRVTDPEGNVFYPNARTSRDPLNNAERVILDVSGKAGVYGIEIAAWNVPFSPQPYALVAQLL